MMHICFLLVMSNDLWPTHCWYKILNSVIVVVDDDVLVVPVVVVIVAVTVSSISLPFLFSM